MFFSEILRECYTLKDMINSDTCLTDVIISAHDSPGFFGNFLRLFYFGFQISEFAGLRLNFSLSTLRHHSTPVSLRDSLIRWPYRLADVIGKFGTLISACNVRQLLYRCCVNIYFSQFIDISHAFGSLTPYPKNPTI